MGLFSKIGDVIKKGVKGLDTALTGGIGQVLGGVASSAVSAMAADRAQKKQIAWERERALNAHQWEVQDLKAAGLNPILSAGGSGATTGGISAPVPDTTGIMLGVTNAIEASRAKADNKLRDAQTLNTDTNSALQTEQILKTRQETINEMRREGLIDAEKQKMYSENLLKVGQAEMIRLELKQKHATIQAEIEKAKQELEILKSQGRKAEAQAKQEEIHAKTLWADKIVNYITKVGGTVTGAVLAGKMPTRAF